MSPLVTSVGVRGGGGGDDGGGRGGGGVGGGGARCGLACLSRGVGVVGPVAYDLLVVLGPRGVSQPVICSPRSPQLPIY
jgi:hypothetical protein